MNSIILSVVAKGIVLVASLFSIYLLIKGHNEPGGGFVAGLVAAAALVLQALAFGRAQTQKRLGARLRPTLWLGLGIASLSGCLGMVAGAPFLKHFHQGIWSSTLLFDIGVFLVVVGSTATILNSFAEAES